MPVNEPIGYTIKPGEQSWTPEALTPLYPAKNQEEPLWSSINAFIEKLEEWSFNIPSKNLWTVEIQLYNDGLAMDKDINGKNLSYSLASLAANIDAVNNSYRTIIGTNWNVKGENQVKLKSYYSWLNDNKIGLFLAQGVEYSTHGVQVNYNAADSINPAAGFMTWGALANGKSPGNSLKIQFLETNWSIADLLFDKWIAAYLQQGGIEDSSLPNIKADILVTEYAHGTPIQMHANWTRRKQIKFIQAFPISRSGGNRLESNAPTGPEISTIEFYYTDYFIEYFEHNSI